MSKSIILIYHFFYPDDVVSAQLFAELAQDLHAKGWQVTVLTSNRYCHYKEKKIVPKIENWNGIKIIRVYRPPFNQSSNLQRLLNTFCMLAMWSIRSLFLPKADVIVLGTDPQFAALLFPFLRLFRRGKKLVHWCHDVYPEAILADKPKGVLSQCARGTKLFMKFSYKYVDVMADLGICMRRRLEMYHHQAQKVTLTPWALVEPKKIPLGDEQTRNTLFGDAELSILYSGNMGRAHDFQLFFKLARECRRKNPKIVFCFACRGYHYSSLVQSISDEDTNIRTAGFASPEELAKRLGCADIHLVSLCEEWSGIVVPSKFFGSLAVGKPVIYAGPKDSAIAFWLEKYKIGWGLTEENIGIVAEQLFALSKNKEDITSYSQKTFDTYQENFSRKKIVDHWDELLFDL